MKRKRKKQKLPKLLGKFIANRTIIASKVSSGNWIWTGRTDEKNDRIELVFVGSKSANSMALGNVFWEDLDDVRSILYYADWKAMRDIKAVSPVHAAPWGVQLDTERNKAAQLGEVES